VIAAHARRQTTERFGPAGGQQRDKKTETNGQVANLQPAPGAIVVTRFWIVRLQMGFCDGH